MTASYCTCLSMFHIDELRLPVVINDYQSVEGLQRHVQALSAQLAETQASLRAERRQSAQWERCVRELSNGTLALAGPRPSPLTPR